MRSKDIARVAGVTVRTLRHYHKMGLLPEPPRAANGYRVYGVRHLIRLLRIVQLTSLGMSLSNIPTVLNDDVIKAETLDDLDRSLALQIETLESQRKLIAALRDSCQPLDMPLEFASSLMALEQGRAEFARKAGREQAVLFGWILNDAGVTEVAGLYDRLARPDSSGIALELGQRFDALDATSDEQEISDLADDYLKYFGPWLAEFENAICTLGKQNAGALLSIHAAESANSQQRTMMALVSQKMRDIPPMIENEKSVP